MRIDNYGWLGLVGLFLSFGVSETSAMQNERGPELVCDFERLVDLERNDLSAAVATVQPLHGQSAEGGQATVLRLGAEVVSIKVSLYGETGRTDITYFRDPGDREAYFVVFKTVQYTVPIDWAGSTTAYESVDRFILCGEEGLKHPFTDAIARAYQVSVDILQLIER